MAPLEIACAVLVPLLWGVQYAVIKAGLAVFPPLFFVGLRFAVVAAILLPFVGRPTRRELRVFLVISVFVGGLNFGLVFVGLAGAPASVTGIANQLWSPFALVLAWPLLGEKPSRRAVVGVLIALAGVTLAVADPAVVVPVVPTLLVVGSALALATGSVLTKRYGPLDPMRLMAWMSLFTVPQVLVASAVTEAGQVQALAIADRTAWLSFAYTVLIGGIGGFGLWFWLLARCAMARLAPFTLLQAAFAIAAGAIFRHEPLTATLVAGAALCIGGVALSQRPAPARHPRSGAPPARVPSTP
ncbi:putative amino-acid metabolite efflux pump [Methylobacterium crusticola]|uniref:Amino-acid metabolite efflux pump n=1 Tax=Methylobacterium crusticola TaxID=1697972 RepID=A0ABQ4QWJ9_9HYPH|nr:EamA family transporter [Methylobacterium crusticola]GJD49755.1 putative amino-acid metabolite efflux pump [Methylobacterium crusticola]